MNVLPDINAMLATVHGDAGGIADRTIAQLYANIPSYAVVPRADLEESIRDIVGIVVDVLRTGTVPESSEIRQAETSSVARARLEIPIQDIMQAFRFTMSNIQSAIVAQGQARGLAPDVMVRMTSLLWTFSDAYTANQVQVHRSADIDRALRLARRRQEYVRALAFGILGPTEAGEAGQEFGLDPSREFRAVRARGKDGDTTEQLRARMESDARRRGLSALFAIVGEECLGVIDGEPSAVSDNAAIAVAGPARLDDMASSFRTAGRILASARTLSILGVVRIADIGWRMAGADTPEMHTYLEARYLEPVRAHGAFGDEILQSVSTFLEQDRSIPRAAESIPLHVNTLRYRLRRFEEITGSSLASTDTIIEVSLALRVTDAVRHGTS